MAVRLRHSDARPRSLGSTASTHGRCPACSASRASLHRYMAGGRHVGKVVLQLRPEEAAGGGAAPLAVPALRRCYPAPRTVHVITGGLGGFGLELAGQCAPIGQLGKPEIEI